MDTIGAIALIGSWCLILAIGGWVEEHFDWDDLPW